MATENADQGVEMSQADFDTAKSSVANCKKFKDNKSATDRTVSRAAYLLIRDAEDVAGQDESALIPEKAYHTEGYSEQIMKVSYYSPRSPNGAREVCEERVVVFVKAGKYGEYSFLSGTDGKPLAINGDLYDSRIESTRHAKGVNYSAYTVPQLGVDGEINGVITLFFGKSTTR